MFVWVCPVNQKNETQFSLPLDSTKIMQTSHQNFHSRSFPAIHYLTVQNRNFVYCAWFLTYLNQCIFPRVVSEWLWSLVLSSQVPLARLAGSLCFLRFSSACAQLILEVSCPSIWTLLFTCYVEYHCSGKFLTTDTNLSIQSLMYTSIYIYLLFLPCFNNIHGS